MPDLDDSAGAMTGRGAGRPRPPRLRVIVAEEDVLYREGLASLLTGAGHEVVAQAGNARDLLGKALAYRPDVAVMDVRMPPGQGADGVLAAVELRRRLPQLGVLVLSHVYDPQLALELLARNSRGVGYLLKTRVQDVRTFTDAVVRLAAGGTALDPEVVSGLVARRAPGHLIDGLSERQREVLSLMAQGRSNRGIADDLRLGEATVEKHITAVFRLLDLEPAASEHRRVRAVLAYLRGTSRVATG